MGIVVTSHCAETKVEPLRVKSTFYRDQIAGMSNAQAKEYLLNVVEGDLAEAQENLALIKDALPHADKQSVQILFILWKARPRIKTYRYISQQLEYLNGKFSGEQALNSAIKRLRRALDDTDFPIEISNHYGIGYNLSAPADWQAPWGNE